MPFSFFVGKIAAWIMLFVFLGLYSLIFSFSMLIVLMYLSYCCITTASHKKYFALFQVETVCGPSPGVAQRLPFCFGVYIPTIPALRKYEFTFHCL
jgi:hypothetical protein